MTETPPRMLGVVDQAVVDAEAAAQAAGLAIRTVSELADLQQIVALFNRVWGNSGPPLISVEMLRALAHSGNYVAAASDLDSETVLGASVGFLAAPIGKVLHSDITGIDVTARDRKLGFALKLHQRAWALSYGLDEVTWTFDPLVARNGSFNLRKLRAHAIAYMVDFYGEMADGVNAGQGSDRLLCTWSLTTPEVVDACGSHPRPAKARQPDAVRRLTRGPAGPQRHEVPPSATQVLVAVPPDIVALRQSDPAAAQAWRLAVRDTLGDEIHRDGRIVGFDPDDGYVVQRAIRTDDGPA